MNSQRYFIPAKTHQIELAVVNSRFIATVVFAETVATTKEALANIRTEMADASHHVYAFRVGFGNSVTEGMSDDGEPTGTAGPPVLAVLRGTNIGDTLVIVTRYFGGTKLGTGGLVRAYSDAARKALSSLDVMEKIPYKTLGVECPYPLYERVKRLINHHHGIIDDEAFMGDVSLIVRFAPEDVDIFIDELSEISAGQIQPIILDAG
jgi:uncharacterized YigZ family protein